MKVYLVQHAKALPEEIDPDRALSKEGHDDAERMAGWAASVGLEVQQIRHSGKTRAEQTANTLAQGLTAPGGVVKFAGLGPVDDVEPIAAELTIAQQPLMLVGHLPFMERMASHLLIGDAEKKLVDFQNAGIVCLEKKEDDVWRLAWAVTPDLVK